MRQHKQAFSLIEILLVLSITIILLVSIFLIYKKIQYDSRIESEYHRIVVIEEGIRSLYRTSSQYPGTTDASIDLTNIIQNSNILDASQFKDNKLYNLFGGQIVLTSARANTFYQGANSAMILKYTNVPRDYCIDFITKIYGISNEIGVNDNGTNVKSAAKVNNFSQIDVGNISSLCNSSSNVIKITFI